MRAAKGRAQTAAASATAPTAATVGIQAGSFFGMPTNPSATCAIGAGASDVDGTVGRELIAHAAGAGTPEELTRHFLETMIRDAGAEPRERDALYRPVHGADAPMAPREVGELE